MEQPLDAIRQEIRRYCVLPGEHEYNAVTLWCAATHLVDCFDYAPRLVVRSAVKRSGKSRLLEVVSEMVRDPRRTSNASTAYIYRALKVKPRTVLLDEADALFGTRTKADSNEDLRALLNAGFQRGLMVGRTVGPNHDPTEFEVFSMAALAGIGKMPDTIEDRAIVVVMQRRKGDETVSPYRMTRDREGLQKVQDLAADWAEAVRDEVKTAARLVSPEIPVEDRAADLWEPLLTVAHLAGEHWPLTARLACKALAAKYAEADEASSESVQLLSDIRYVFGADPLVKSKDLCESLKSLEDSPWREQDLSPSKLGCRLRDFDITTAKRTVGGERAHYYERAAFSDAFARFLDTAPDKVGQVGHLPPDVRKSA